MPELTTEKQKEYLAIVKETGDVNLAGKQVFPAEAPGSILSRRPNLKREVVRVLEQKGLSEGDLITVLKKVVDTVDREKCDLHAVLRALEMGFKIHGSFAPEETNVKVDVTWKEELSDADIKREIIDALENFEVEEGEERPLLLGETDSGLQGNGTDSTPEVVSSPPVEVKV